MKKLFLVLTLVFVINGNVLALSDCPKDTSVEWDNCFGTYTASDGSTYTGGFKNNLYHGQGTVTFANGDTYIGEYRKDLKHGQGTLIFSKEIGGKYIGTYENDDWIDGIIYKANGNKIRVIDGEIQ